jgi:hypothetical protein
MTIFVLILKMKAESCTFLLMTLLSTSLSDDEAPLQIFWGQYIFFFMSRWMPAAMDVSLNFIISSVYKNKSSVRHLPRVVVYSSTKVTFHQPAMS